jgi:hypothetical protein
VRTTPVKTRPIVDPDHDDALLADLEKRCQQLLPTCVFARENMTLVV